MKDSKIYSSKCFQVLPNHNKQIEIRTTKVYKDLSGIIIFEKKIFIEKEETESELLHDNVKFTRITQVRGVDNKIGKRFIFKPKIVVLYKKVSKKGK
jgi:hypothetical protein